MATTEILERMVLRALREVQGDEFVQVSDIQRYLEENEHAYKNSLESSRGALRKKIARTLENLHKKSSSHKDYDSQLTDRRVIQESRKNKAKNAPNRYRYNSDVDPDDLFASDDDVNEETMLVTSLLMERYFKYAVPPDDFSKFKNYLIRMLPSDKKAKSRRDVFSFAARGLQLEYEATVELERALISIYKAIYDKKFISFDFLKIEKGKERVKEVRAVPIGIIYADPKMYMVTGSSNDPLERYIIQNISNVQLLDDKVDKKLKTFQQWQKNRPVTCPDGFEDRDYSVQLKVFDRGDLIRDVLTFKLSNQQEEKFKRDGSLELKLPSQPISQTLVNWIIERSADVQVLAPNKLKNHVHDRLRRTLALYES